MMMVIMDNIWENWGWLESDSDEQSTIETEVSMYNLLVSSFQKSDGYLWSVSLED